MRLAPACAWPLAAGGNKWALQTSQQNITTTAGWQDNVNSVVWPEVGQALLSSCVGLGPAH